MPADDSITGWHSTDDEVVVPVRQSAMQTASEQAGPAADISHGNADHIVLHHHGATVNPASMRLSAFLGVVLVLGAIGFHFGLDNIFGDLTGGSETTDVTVEITTEGVFEPDTITLHPGDKLTLTNKNPDPQVIKSKDGREIFPVQVLFETPFEFTVPTDANGTFTYFSETLPDDKTLTITIEPKQAAAITSSEPATEAPLEIPLPFAGGETVSTSTETSAQSSSSAPAVAIQKTEHSGETATISLGGSETQETNLQESFTSQIPVNPYTVTSGLEQQNKIEAIVAAAKEAQNLHSGAPLQQIVTHKPKSVTSTGPEGALVLLIPALAGVAMLYRKLSII